MSIARRARHESKVCKTLMSIEQCDAKMAKVWKTLIGFFFRGYPNRAYEPWGEGQALAELAFEFSEKR